MEISPKVMEYLNLKYENLIGFCLPGGNVFLNYF